MDKRQRSSQTKFSTDKTRKHIRRKAKGRKGKWPFLVGPVRDELSVNSIKQITKLLLTNYSTFDDKKRGLLFLFVFFFLIRKSWDSISYTTTVSWSVFISLLSSSHSRSQRHKQTRQDKGLIIIKSKRETPKVHSLTHSLTHWIRDDNIFVN